MRYIALDKCSTCNGIGFRVVLWVTGCNHKCKGCQNPHTWDSSVGSEFTERVYKQIDKELDKYFIEGITFSGGDPLYPDNRKEILEIVKHIRNRYSHQKSIWLYTGYLWEEVKDIDIIKYIDVLVDGEFDIGKRDITLAWRGSSNQKVINVPLSLRYNKEVLLEV